MVLGGLPSDLRRMVVRDAMRAVLPGMLAGAVGALLAVRMMRTLVYGVSPTDPVSFAVVAALLLGVALLASWLPAHRATRVDPLLAVRGE
jgi:ABC-type lipoprotein release transport system permease subunit